MNSGDIDKFHSDREEGYDISTILVDAITEIEPMVSVCQFTLENKISPMQVIGYSQPFGIIDSSIWNLYYEVSTLDPLVPSKHVEITIANSDMVDYCRDTINKVPDISHRYNLLTKLRVFENV